MPVTGGETVQVHYSGSLADGTVFDSSDGRDPLTFVVGAHQVIPGFEKAVMGMEVGDKVTVTIEPDEAYGPRHEELQQSVSLSDFESEPCVGGMVELVSPEGERLPGTIVGIEGDKVAIDFNHPLAGETLTFEVSLVGIEPGAE